jgi:hypothetical protein
VTIDFRFRPIDTWPGALRDESARTTSPFTTGYSDTLEVLRRELGHLNAERIVIQLDLSDRDIRLDGLPRANANPGHPGVILGFDSKHGPLRYATDVYTRASWRRNSVGWHANLRAIALGLEALRKVDRYGITKTGEQYRGFAELPSGIPMSGPTHMTTEDAARFVAKWGGGGWQDVLDRTDQQIRSIKRAAFELHPDRGGNAQDFQRLQDAKRILERAGGAP